MQDIQVGPRILKREKQSDAIAGFKDKRGPLAKEWGEPLESGKGKEQIFLEPQRACSPTDTSTLAQWAFCLPVLWDSKFVLSHWACGKLVKAAIGNSRTISFTEVTKIPKCITYVIFGHLGSHRLEYEVPKSAAASRRVALSKHSWKARFLTPH